jgi:hypothetical protein
MGNAGSFPYKVGNAVGDCSIWKLHEGASTSPKDAAQVGNNGKVSIFKLDKTKVWCYFSNCF